MKFGHPIFVMALAVLLYAAIAAVMIVWYVSVTTTYAHAGTTTFKDGAEYWWITEPDEEISCWPSAEFAGWKDFISQRGYARWAFLGIYAGFPMWPEDQITVIGAYNEEGEHLLKPAEFAIDYYAYIPSQDKACLIGHSKPDNSAAL